MVSDIERFQSVEKLILILKGVDLMDHTSIFLLRTINHYATLIMCSLPSLIVGGSNR